MDECTNSKIKITKLTNSIIDAKCLNCGRKTHAERQFYSEEEWKQMTTDANKHINGEFED